jgi:hypothetical protein
MKMAVTKSRGIENTEIKWNILYNIYLLHSDADC